MQIQIDIPSDEAKAVERLLSVLMDRYAADLSTVALSGAVRVRQALALGVKAGAVRHYTEQAAA